MLSSSNIPLISCKYFRFDAIPEIILIAFSSEVLLLSFFLSLSPSGSLPSGCLSFPYVPPSLGLPPLSLISCFRASKDSSISSGSSSSCAGRDAQREERCERCQHAWSPALLLAQGDDGHHVSLRS